jgi:transposase
LEELGRIIDLEAFHPVLVAALAYGNGARGGRPPYDPVAMFKVLVLAAQNNVADARMEYLIRDRLSWLRFLGFDLGAPTPDANTIRLFREKLTETGALDAVFSDFDRQLKERGYRAMGGQMSPSIGRFWRGTAVTQGFSSPVHRCSKDSVADR